MTMIAGWGFVAVLALVVILAALVWAVVDIMRTPWLATADRVIWLVIVFLLPLVGAAVWLLMRGGLAKREE